MLADVESSGDLLPGLQVVFLLCPHKKREGTLVCFSSYKDTNSISWSYLNQIASDRPHLLISSHWELGFQHINLDKHTVHNNELGLLLAVSYTLTLIYYSFLALGEKPQSDPLCSLASTPSSREKWSSKEDVWVCMWFLFSFQEPGRWEWVWSCRNAQWVWGLEMMGPVCPTECCHDRTAASWLLIRKRPHQPLQMFNIG